MGYGPYGPAIPRPEVPQWVKDAAGKVEEFASWLGLHLGEAWDYLWGFLSDPGDQDALNKARDSWTAEKSESVKSLLTAARNHLEEEAKYVDLNWSGPAAKGFQRYVYGQGGQAGLLANFNALAACCDSMATALKDIRDVLSELWIWLIVLLITFVAWAIVCIAIAFPGGWGFVKFLEVTGAFLAAVAVAVVNARNTLNQAQGAIDTLQDVDTDTPGFPGGKWPRPGVALNDGSIRDGDASDWRVRVAG